MAVLEDDTLNLEIEPVKVYNSMSPQKRLEVGFQDPVDPSKLEEFPGMKQHLAKVYHKIILFCKAFIKCLTDRLPSMPYGVRWVCRQVARAAMKKNISPADTSSLIGDLIFLRYISPAIVYPEPYGIITDTPVSPQARKNLTMIAKVLRTIARGTTNKSNFQREKHMVPLMEKLSDVNMEPFFAGLQDVRDLTEELVTIDEFDQFRGRGLKVAITPRYLALLKTILQERVCFSTTPPPLYFSRKSEMNSNHST